MEVSELFVALTDVVCESQVVFLHLIAEEVLFSVEVFLLVQLLFSVELYRC